MWEHHRHHCTHGQGRFVSREDAHRSLSPPPQGPHSPQMEPRLGLSSKAATSRRPFRSGVLTVRPFIPKEGVFVPGRSQASHLLPPEPGHLHLPSQSLRRRTGPTSLRRIPEKMMSAHLLDSL